jgi:hypothetical protein
LSELTKSEQEIIDLQLPSGKCLILQDQNTGLLSKHYWSNDNFLAERFHRKITSETDWFEKIIKHAPTVGGFYENLIRTTLKEFAPSSNKIGTGFVFDSSRHKHGKQIDVLIYDDSDRSVIYRSDNFVVINPSSVISAIEVKKTLNSTNLKDVVRSTFYNNLGGGSNKYSNVQKIKVFAFALSCKKETICNALVDILEQCVETLKVGTENGLAMLPITYCSLPDVHFLDENFYLETSVVKKESGHFSLKVTAIHASQTGSLGVFLESVVREKRNNTGPQEHSYFSNPIKPIPDTYDVKGEFVLVDIINFPVILDIFSNFEQLLLDFRYQGLKPLSLHVPKGVDISSYESPIEFFKLSGSLIEFFNEDEPLLVKSNNVEL